MMDLPILAFANDAADDRDVHRGLILELLHLGPRGPLLLFFGFVSSFRDGALALLFRFMNSLRGPLLLFLRLVSGVLGGPLQFRVRLVSIVRWRLYDRRIGLSDRRVLSRRVLDRRVVGRCVLVR